MKTIVCYGDSNTWGWDPATESRFPRDVRWPGVLRAALGPDYEVIEEALNGRTTVWDDPIEEHKNGKTYLMPCLQSHKPIDLVILMLGTNDLKQRFSLSAFDIAAGAERLVRIIQTSQAGPDEGAPQILLISPARVHATRSDWGGMFEGAQAKSAELAAYFKRVSEEFGTAFLDAAPLIAPSPVDGLHLDAEGHRTLGEAVVQAVRAIFAG